MRDWPQKFLHVLHAPADASTLGTFRAVFGVCMIAHLVPFLRNDVIRNAFVLPGFHFSYPGFSWIRAAQEPVLVGIVVVMIAAAALVAAGVLFRPAAAALAAGYWYLFLLDAAYYLNHGYLIALLASLLALMPAHRAFVLGVRTAPVTAPGWAVFTLRAQIAIAYWYGGIAKLNDGWMSGDVMRAALDARSGALSALANPTGVTLLTWGGVLFDLLIIPALLVRRTRTVALAAAVAFNLMNALLFDIGIFPWLMIASTYVLFRTRSWRPAPMTAPTSPRFVLTATVCAYLAFQLLFPLRHHLYPGDVNWTEEGITFSWHMMSRVKRGTVRFEATSPSQGTTVEVSPDGYLNDRQRELLAETPEFMRQFAHHAAERLRKKGITDAQVRAISTISLNGLPPAPLVDPTVDLAAQPWRLGNAQWIMPSPARK